MNKPFFDEWNNTCRKNPRTNLIGGFKTVAKDFLIVGRGNGQFDSCLKKFWNSEERNACEQQHRADQCANLTLQPQGAATYNFSPGAFAPGALSPGAFAQGALSPGVTNHNFGGVHNHYYNPAGSPPPPAPTFDNNSSSSNEDAPAPAPSFNNGSNNNNNNRNGSGTYMV